MKPAIKSPAEAWQEVLGKVSSVGRYRLPTFSSPAIADAVFNIGGWASICESQRTALPTLRAKFFDVFKIEKET